MDTVTQAVFSDLDSNYVVTLQAKTPRLFKLIIELKDNPEDSAGLVMETIEDGASLNPYVEKLKDNTEILVDIELIDIVDEWFNNTILTGHPYVDTISLIKALGLNYSEEALRDILVGVMRKLLDPQILAQVIENGWYGIMVGGSESQEPFSYTLGICKDSLPDMILFGGISNQGFNVVVETVLNYFKTEGFKLGLLAEVEFEPSIYILPVPKNKISTIYDQYMTGTERFYKQYPDYLKLTEHQDQIVQVVLSDASGKFPWEPEYDTKVRQTLISNIKI